MNYKLLLLEVLDVELDGYDSEVDGDGKGDDKGDGKVTSYEEVEQDDKMLPTTPFLPNEINFFNRAI